MTDELHPTDGARFLLERASHDDKAARYTATIYTPEHAYRYELNLEAPSTVRLTADDTPADAKLERKLTTIAKIVARDAANAGENGLPPWPTRILRWRKA